MSPEPQAWGYKIPISAGTFSESVVVWRPKWWQFWRKPKTLPLAEALQRTQDFANVRMVSRLIPASLLLAGLSGCGLQGAIGPVLSGLGGLGGTSSSVSLKQEFSDVEAIIALVHQHEMAVSAIEQSPVVTMVPTPVVVMPGTPMAPPVVTPVNPPPIPAPKPVPVLP